LKTIGKRRYWLYAPGRQAGFWDEFFAAGIMGIGWDEVSDLSRFNSKEDIKNALRQGYDAGRM